MLVNSIQKGVTAKKLPFYISGMANKNISNATSLSIGSPTGIQVGDLLVSCVGSSSSSVNFPTVSGWTEVFDSGSMSVKYKVATDTDGSGTFTVSDPTLLSGSIVVFRNADYDNVGTLVSTTASPLVSSNISASVPDCVLLAFVYKYISSVFITSTEMDSNLISNSDSNSPSLAVFMNTLSAAGWTGTKSFVVGSSGTYGDALLVTLKPK